jgi:hypothetical protein
MASRDSTRPAGAFLPSWRLKTGGIIAPDERLPWGQTIVVGVQHVIAMFGATVLMPIVMGFDPNVAILFSGRSRPPRRKRARCATRLDPRADTTTMGPS